MHMKIKLLISFLLASFTVAAEPITPRDLLPANTFAVATVPNVAAARKALQASAPARLWNDPAMKAFTDKFEAQLEEKIMEPLLLFADFNLDEYTELLQGQLTFAFTRQENELAPGFIFLADSGANGEKLAAKVESLREALVESGVPHNRLRLEGRDFLHIVAPVNGPDDEEEERRPRVEAYIGQAGSLFIMASTRALALQLAKQQAKPNPKESLATNAEFAGRHKAQLKDALGYAWLDFNVVLDYAMELERRSLDPENPPGPLDPTVGRTLDATGLRGLKSVSVTWHEAQAGGRVEMFLHVPAAARRGLFTMFAGKKGDASPPAWVPANVTSFARWRADGQQLWKQFEEMITGITPLAPGALGGAEGVVRAKAPEFNFREQVIGTLADDFIIMEPAPTGDHLQELITPSTLYLMKSTKPDITLKALLTIVQVASEQEAEESKVAGRTVYSFPITLAGQEGPQISVHAAAAKEYVALTLHENTMKSFLAGPSKDMKKLADRASLKADAIQVGGMESGFFAYENQRPFARSIFHYTKDNPNFLEELLKGFQNPDLGQPDVAINDWLDFRLLPDFKQVQKYFHFSVAGQQVTEQGISWRLFAPALPK